MALAVALVLPGLRLLSWAGPRGIAVEAAAVERGEKLFTHEWKPNDPLTGSDGLGPVFNAKSCVACHGSPSVGGASGTEHNVTMYTILPTRPGEEIKQGVVHAQAVDRKYRETLQKVDPSLPDLSQPKFELLSNRGGRPAFGFTFTIPTNIVLSQRNTPALYGAKWIDEIPDRVIVAQERKERLHWGLAQASSDNFPVGRALRLPDGRVGKFGWKAQSASLLEFVQAACANELGLSNPTQPQPNPIGQPNYVAKGTDLTAEQCQQMTDFLYALARPVVKAPAEGAERTRAEMGHALFHQVGCADCHTPNLGSVEGLYSDLLLHRMGLDLQGGGFYYGSPTPIPTSVASAMPMADEWRTPPLWGVADSGPYLHDGRAKTLDEAITLHGGQGARAAAAYGQLSPDRRESLVAFLKTLRAP
jgi:CxxC motif-containing protein (DUF1111 family)